MLGFFKSVFERVTKSGAAAGDTLLGIDGTTNEFVGFDARTLGLKVVLTASLPAAAAAMDGQVLIEDGGTGDRNLIVYAGGQRFRIDGGSNV